MAKCRECHAEILWAVTVNDKRMPLDAIPDPDGNVRLTGEMVQTDRGEAPRCEVGRPTLFDAATEWYMPHFSTCPKAEKFRR